MEDILRQDIVGHKALMASPLESEAAGRDNSGVFTNHPSSWLLESPPLCGKYLLGHIFDGLGVCPSQVPRFVCQLKMKSDSILMNP